MRWLRKVLLECPIQDLREAFLGLLVHVLACLAPLERSAYQTITPTATDGEAMDVVAPGTAEEPQPQPIATATAPAKEDDDEIYPPPFITPLAKPTGLPASHVILFFDGLFTLVRSLIL